MQREIDKLAGAACPDSRMTPDLGNAGASLTSKAAGRPRDLAIASASERNPIASYRPSKRRAGARAAQEV